MTNISITINGDAVEVEHPLSLTLDKTIDFDKCFFIIAHSDRELPYIEGDEIVITIDGEVFTLILDSDIVTQINDDTWQHDISGIEITSLLSKYVSPARYFTVNSDGTQMTYKKHAEIFIDTVPLNGDSPVTLPTATQDLLDFVAPQQKYDNPHLLKDFQQLFRSANGIPRVLPNRELSFDLYDAPNNPITLGDLIGQRREKQFSNYGLSLRVNAKNIVRDGSVVSSGTFSPNKSGGVQPRTEGNYSDTKAKYFLNTPIRKIIFGVIVDYELKNGTIIDLPLAEWQIVSKERYDGLEIGSNLRFEIYQAGEPVQRNTLYYTVGNNTVEGMGEEVDIVGFNPIKIELVVRTALEENGYDGDTDFKSFDLKNLRMRFFYQQYVNNAVTSQKNTGVTKHSTIKSNQSADVIDITRYAVVMRNTINQLANGRYQIKKNHDTWSQKFEQGDFTSDGYQIIKSDFIIGIDGFDATYELAKDFTNIDIETSVINTNTPFTIERTNIDTDFVYTQYIEAGTTKKNLTTGVSQEFINALFNQLDFDINDDKPIYQGEFYSPQMRDINTLINGLSIPVTCVGTTDGIRIFSKFQSPNVAGIRMQDNELGGLKGNPVVYTDDGGGFISGEWCYVNDHIVISGQYPIITRTATPSLKLPSINYYLQPNEIYGMTAELLWYSNEDIYLYEPFFTNNSLTKELAVSNPNLTIVYYEGVDVEYGIYTKEILAGSTGSSKNFTIDKINREIDVENIPQTATSTWVLVDEITFEIYMAVNYKGQAKRKIYLNVLNDRDGITNL